MVAILVAEEEPLDVLGLDQVERSSRKVSRCTIASVSTSMGCLPFSTIAFTGSLPTPGNAFGRHVFETNGERGRNLRVLKAKTPQPKRSAFKAYEPGYFH